MSYAVAVSNTNASRLGLPDCSESVKDRHPAEIIFPCEDTFVAYEDESGREESSNSSWLGSIRRGMFKGRQKPNRIVFAGYSFGGGTIDRLLSERWERIGQNIPASAAVIDPITLGADDCGHPVEHRPLHLSR